MPTTHELQLLPPSASNRHSPLLRVVPKSQVPHSAAPTHLQGQVRVLLLLADLEAGQVGVLQLQVVFLLEVLSHGALHRLTTLQLQGKPAEAGHKGAPTQNRHFQTSHKTCSGREEGSGRLPLPAPIKDNEKQPGGIFRSGVRSSPSLAWD